MIPDKFKGRARRLDDVDLPRLGARIGVGEDEIHAVLDVESRGSGFDAQGRPLILFEPHRFYALLGSSRARDEAIVRGLAYPVWGARPYPKDSYPRLIEAMSIDETAALKSASWGLGQIMGENHKAAGYATVQRMVAAFCDDEEAHLAAMVAFIKESRLDDELRRHDWHGFARGYNGPLYAKHDYAGRLARAYAKWRGVKDTPWSPADAIKETQIHDPAPDVVADPPVPVIDAAPRPTPPRESIPAPAPFDPPAPAGFWAGLRAFIVFLFKKRPK